jgi:hypothetical protein
MNNSNNNELWYQLSFEDDNCLSGKSICHFLEAVQKIVSFQTITVDEAIGTFGPTTFVEGKPIDYREFVLTASNIIQFDWAFFFLNLARYEGEVSINQRFTQSRLIIRPTDSTYLYIYSRNKSVINKMAQVAGCFDIKSCKYDELDILY